MLVIQVLMALILGVGDFGIPSTFLHDFPGTKIGILRLVMAIHMKMIYHQVRIFDVPQSVSITDTWNGPSSVVDASGYGLTQFNCFVHDASFERKKAPANKDRSQ
jgi:hypothetical protein